MTTRPPDSPFDPERDLVVERTINAPATLVWKAWTEPEHLKKWFTPPPWRTVDCEIDLRPGGIFRTVMRSPEGQDSPNHWCYLDVVANERLVWTTALGAGYRPGSGKGFILTAIITLESDGDGTKCVARAMHHDSASRQHHEDMGFYDGWGTVLKQMADLAEAM